MLFNNEMTMREYFLSNTTMENRNSLMISLVHKLTGNYHPYDTDEIDTSSESSDSINTDDSMEISDDLNNNNIFANNAVNLVNTLYKMNSNDALILIKALSPLIYAACNAKAEGDVEECIRHLIDFLVDHINNM